MSIKSIILATATVAVTATAGAADSYFEIGENLDRSSVLSLGLVRAEGAGVVEIYDYHRGEQGRLLGTQTVNAGANTDVRVGTGIPARNDVLAVIKVDGQIVATKQYDIN